MAQVGHLSSVFQRSTRSLAWVLTAALSRLANVPNPSPWLAYGVAIMATILATFFRWLLGPYLDPMHPFMTYYPMVMLAALFGGAGPGLLTTFLAALIVPNLFHHPPGIPGDHLADQVGLLLFIAINVAVSFLCGALRAARHGIFAEARRAQASEERFRLFMENTPTLAWIKDDQGRYTYINKAYEQRFGHSFAECQGKTDADLWPAEVAARLQQADQAALAAGHPIELTEQTTGPDGEVSFWLNTKFTLRDAAGRQFIASIGLDITDRKRFQEAVQESEARLRLALETAELGMYERDFATDKIILNPACKAILAATEPFPPDLARRALHPEDRDRVLAEVGRALDPNVRAICSAEFRLLRPDGTVRWVAGRGRVVFDEQCYPPKPARFIGVLNDITHRKEYEEALLEQARLTQLRADVVQILQDQGPLRALLQRVAAQLVQGLDAAFARVWTLDSAGETLELQASAGLYTHLDGEHSRVRVGQLKIGRIAQQRRPLFTNQILGDPNIPAQDWVRREGLVSFAGFPLVLEDRLLGVVALFARHPLSQAAFETFATVASSLAQGFGRLLAEQALRSSEARLTQAIHVARLGTFDHDLVADTIEFSPQMRHLFGFGPSDAVTLPAVMERVPPEEREAILVASRRAQDPAGNGLLEIDHRIVVPGRETRWVSVRAQTLFTGEGSHRSPLRVIGAVLDITDQKEHAAALGRLVRDRTAQLQETVNELEHFSYTITHDMRAPLRAISGYANILSMSQGHQLDDEGRDLLRRIDQSSLRMDQLITDALQYSRVVRGRFQLEPLDPAAAIIGIVEAYPQFQPPRACITVQPNMPRVLANQAALTQVFSNLLGNAVKFVTPGQLPRITVTAEVAAHHGVPVSTVNSPAATMSPRQDQAPTEWVRIWVCDNGIGIAPEYQARIWQMFQRLDKNYEGTGIGLALVQKVVERMGGRVGVESAPDQGSRFWVELQKAP